MQRHVPCAQYLMYFTHISCAHHIPNPHTPSYAHARLHSRALVYTEHGHCRCFAINQNLPFPSPPHCAKSGQSHICQLYTRLEPRPGRSGAVSSCCCAILSSTCMPAATRWSPPCLRRSGARLPWCCGAGCLLPGALTLPHAPPTSPLARYAQGAGMVWGPDGSGLSRSQQVLAAAKRSWVADAVLFCALPSWWPLDAVLASALMCCVGALWLHCLLMGISEWEE